MKKIFSEIVQIISGGTPSTNINYYWGGNIPWLSIKDFVNANKYVITTEKTITNEGLKNSTTHILNRGDIIFSARGTLGKVAILSKNMAFNQSCYGLRTKNSNFLLQEYLFYWLISNKHSMQKKAHGAVFDTFTRSDFDSMTINVPDPIDQQHIVNTI